MWVELNKRVSYPFKKVLIEMVESNIVNMADEAYKFAVHYFASSVAKIGMQSFIPSWNAYHIPDQDILQQQNSRNTYIHPSELPSADDSV